MKTRSVCLLACAALSGTVTAQVQNTGLAVVFAPIGMRAEGDLLAFAAPEIQQNADLDGDGDIQSWVMHVKVGTYGSVENLHLPVPYIFPPGNTPPFQMSERLVAFLVVENELASTTNPSGTDLNGDGDVLDRVVHVYDRATHQVVNTQLAGVTVPTGLAVVGDSVVMGVLESAQGMDLDGDGAQNSTVACTWTAPGILRVTARPISVASGFSTSVASAGGRAYFRERESLSLVDRNADGDLFDDVLQEMDLATGAITNLGLDADDLVASGPVLAFRVGEANQGNVDLNGDGDKLDRVQHVRIASIGVTRNFHLAIKVDSTGRTFTTVAGHLIAMRVHESFVPPVDFNGDGDTTDDVLFVHDARANVTWNTYTAVLPDGNIGTRPFLIDGSSVLFVVPEFLAGAIDLNGDGDLADRVVNVFSGATGLVTNLGLAVANSADPAFRVSKDWFLFAVGETNQGNADLNGNSVVGESVLHVIDRNTGTVSNLGIGVALEADVVLRGKDLLYTDYEFITGDQNGDGDMLDNVLRHRDGATGAITNLGLGVASNSNQPGVLGMGEFAAVYVAESGNSTDLNGDGDWLDGVLHFVRN